MAPIYIYAFTHPILVVYCPLFAQLQRFLSLRHPYPISFSPFSLEVEDQPGTQMTADEWVAAALTDDAVVAELLFRLKQSTESLALPRPKQPTVSLPRWGQRQPRSKPAVLRKEGDSTRCSPTTPLSWSCGGGGDGSPSDGCDESSRPSDCFSGGRSKGIFSSETAANGTSANKRSRKKKTFAELKEEESLLLKERMHLKKELATLRVTLKEQKDRSENLKRLKLDLHIQSAKKRAATSDEPEATNLGQSNLVDVSSLGHVSVLRTITMPAHHQAAAPCNVEKEAETRERCFILPDLNAMPSEEDSSSETPYVAS